MKGHGTIGARGVLALQRATAQEPGAGQGLILATCHALIVIMRQQAVKVRTIIKNTFKVDSNTLNAHHSGSLFLAEGSWNSWGSWGACSTTCDSTGTWSRSRTFNGNMPCTGSATETGGCQSKLNNIFVYRLKVCILFEGYVFPIYR